MAAKKTAQPTPPKKAAKAADKGDAYYAEMEASKVAAGLSLEQAREVTARQREWDNAQTVGDTEAEPAADPATPPAEPPSNDPPAETPPESPEA